MSIYPPLTKKIKEVVNMPLIYMTLILYYYNYNNIDVRVKRFCIKKHKRVVVNSKRTSAGWREHFFLLFPRAKPMVSGGRLFRYVHHGLNYIT